MGEAPKRCFFFFVFFGTGTRMLLNESPCTKPLYILPASHILHEWLPEWLPGAFNTIPVGMPTYKKL